jgi:FkbM family methyltransferase
MTLELSQGVLNRRVFNEGVFNSHKRDFMLGQTPPYISKEKDVLDVGAAVGMYSHFWAPLCRHLYAFEAVPPVFGQLLKVEERHNNMTAINKAVGAFNGEADFYVDDKRLSNSSFRDLVGGQKIVVPVTQLDSCKFDKVGFIKIDVEGHELDVLNGAIDIVVEQRPTVMCEIYPKFNNGPVLDTFQYFFELGYKCFYNVKGQGLEPIVNPAHGVDIADDPAMIAKHDGDFLFVPETAE